MCRQPIITQSVGVPLTAKRFSAMARSRSGEVKVRECEAPDCSFSGATTQTSSDRLRAIFSATVSPGEWMPSSLVTRMRMDFLLAKNTTPNRHGPPECGPSRWVRNQSESETQISSGWPAFAGHDSYALSLKLLNDLLAHIGLQHIRDSDAAIGL